MNGLKQSHGQGQLSVGGGRELSSLVLDWAVVGHSWVTRREPGFRILLEGGSGTLGPLIPSMYPLCETFNLIFQEHLPLQTTV